MELYSTELKELPYISGRNFSCSNKFLTFWEIEFFSPNLKKLLYFFQKKNFSYISGENLQSPKIKFFLPFLILNLYVYSSSSNFFHHNIFYFYFLTTYLYFSKSTWG